MPPIAFIALRISKPSLLSENGLTTISPCVLSPGAPRNRSYLLFPICNTSLTNLHCRVTNALDISIKFSRYAGIYVFWNAPPAAGSEHRLSQTVHCRSPGMTIAGFFRFVFITAFTSFLQDLYFILYDGFKLDFLVFRKAVRYRLFSPRRCDGKNPPPKTPSQSSQPSRIVARQGFNGSLERNWSAGVCGNWCVHFGWLPFICANRWASGGRFFFSVMFFPRFPFGFAHTLLNRSYLRRFKYV